MAKIDEIEMDIKISIIIPFYNVEQYVAECLDSVFNQNLSEDEYEVICINDGSTDGSRKVVEGYLAKHPNMSLVDHPHNINLGSARNTGVKAAKGKYIWHVDSDDGIMPNCLKPIVEICEERQLDVLEFGYIGAHDLPISIGEPARTREVVTGIEYINRYFMSNFGAICPIWRRVYRRAFLEANAIKSPSINMGEDEPYAIHVFVTAERVSFEPEDWYKHRINTSSLVGEDKKNWSAKKWYEASILCAKNLNYVYKKVYNKMPPVISQQVREMVMYNVHYYIRFEEMMSVEAQKGFWQICKQEFWNNLYVFLYLGKKNAVDYIRHVLAV